MGACRDGFEIRRGDSGYPRCVAELPQVPPVLYVRGDATVLDLPSLSIVGSRRASPYGSAICELAAGIAVESGIPVVSGGARGCDQVAGWATLNAGGRHIVVLGTGADVVYPSTAKALVDRVIETGGCVISIEPWGTPPQRWAFPKRNRVIAALSSATFVAEAGLPSGTFSTAEAANELGREVLAAPGSIFSPESRGSNYLIANGACCIADEEALEVAREETARTQAPYIWITGGAQLYAQTLPLLDEAVVTDLELDVAASAPEGATFVYAPPLDPALWRRDESRSDSEWRERSGDARWRVSTWVQR